MAGQRLVCELLLACKTEVGAVHVDHRLLAIPGYAYPTWQWRERTQCGERKKRPGYEGIVDLADTKIWVKNCENVREECCGEKQKA